MQALHLTKIEADSNGITENQSSVYFHMKLRSCVFALNVSSKASQLIRCRLMHTWTGNYCKTRLFRVPFISWILRAWQVRENNGPRKFEYSSVSV